MNKKNKNTKSSPFHKYGKRARRKGDASDFWNIGAKEKQIKDAFGRFSRIDTGKNLFAGAENLMNIGDNYGDIQTDFEAQNAFAGIQNEQQGLRNEYAGMENTMEDLTVNQQQAQFEAQQGQQQRANIMQQMGGAAGGSGVAGLAQAMANQGQLATQRASASIGQQEAANQMAAAQQAGRLQEMSAGGAERAAIARASGAERAAIARATGQQAGSQFAQQLSSSAELAQAGGMQQADIAAGQGAMEAQKYRLQGAADARDLQLQQAQGELSFLSGQQAGREARRQSDTSYKFSGGNTNRFG